MFIDSRRSDFAWPNAVLGRGTGRRESEEPVLEEDMLWRRIHTDTRRIRGKVDEYLVVGQFWDG